MNSFCSGNLSIATGAVRLIFLLFFFSISPSMQKTQVEPRAARLVDCLGFVQRRIRINNTSESAAGIFSVFELGWKDMPQNEKSKSIYCYNNKKKQSVNTWKFTPIGLDCWRNVPFGMEQSDWAVVGLRVETHNIAMEDRHVVTSGSPARPQW